MTKPTLWHKVSRMADPTMPPLVARALKYGGRTAIVDCVGSYTYDDLLEASGRVAAALLAGRDDLAEERVAFLVTPGFPWVAVLWGIWRAGGIAVPLPLGSPPAELEYFVGDTQAAMLIADDANQEVLARAGAACNLCVRSCNEAARASSRRSLPDIAQPAAGDDSLHQRHHQPSQGRSHDA